MRGPLNYGHLTARLLALCRTTEEVCRATERAAAHAPRVVSLAQLAVVRQAVNRTRLALRRAETRVWGEGHSGG
jgi:hypothetical protein